MKKKHDIIATHVEQVRIIDLMTSMLDAKP